MVFSLTRQLTVTITMIIVFSETTRYANGNDYCQNSLTKHGFKGKILEDVENIKAFEKSTSYQEVIRTSEYIQGYIKFILYLNDLISIVVYKPSKKTTIHIYCVNIDVLWRVGYRGESSLYDKQIDTVDLSYNQYIQAYKNESFIINKLFTDSKEPRKPDNVNYLHQYGYDIMDGSFN